MQPVCRWSIYTHTVTASSQQEHVKMMFLAGLGDAVTGSISASSALQVACIEVKRQGQYQSFAYPIVSEYSSEISPLETLHACLTEGAMLKTAQALTSYKIPKEHLLWVPYATLCMLLQNRISLVYIYTKQHYRGWYQQNSFATPSREASH